MPSPAKRRPRGRKAAKSGSPGAAGIRLAFGLARLAAHSMAALVPTVKPARKPAKKPKAEAKAQVPGLVSRPKSSFSAGTHDCPQGSLRYRLFKPPISPAGKPPPLLIMLHGCAQTPEGFAAATGMNALAKERGVIVVYPAQSPKAHPNRCWNWFDPAQTTRGMGEAAKIASLTRLVLDRHGADPARVYVAGLSAGASMALLLAHAYPDLFAAVGVHSGLPVGAARDQATAILSMQRGNPGIRLTRPIPTIVFHGSKDHVVHPRNGRLIAIRAREAYAALRHAQSFGSVAQGHAYIKAVDRIGAGRALVEHWSIQGAGHAWSGGSPRGRFTDPKGPDASHEMLRFLLRHSLAARARKSMSLQMGGG